MSESQQEVSVSILAGTLTQEFLAEPAEIKYLEPNRWMLVLPGCVVTDTRGGVDGWDLGLLINGSNVSSFLIARVRMNEKAEGSAPGASVVASNDWVKGGTVDPVARKGSEIGPAGSTGGQWEVRVEAIMHVTGDEQPTDLQVEMVLI